MMKQRRRMPVVAVAETYRKLDGAGRNAAPRKLTLRGKGKRFRRVDPTGDGSGVLCGAWAIDSPGLALRELPTNFQAKPRIRFVMDELLVKTFSIFPPRLPRLDGACAKFSLRLSFK
jgi:hypothetical protein